MKNKCPKCGCAYMTKRPSAPDTDWVCASCKAPVDFAQKEIIVEIDFTLMSNIAEEVEREHEGLLPFTEMVNIMLSKYYAAQQSAQADAAYCSCKNPDIYINRVCQSCGKPHALRR